MQTQRIDLGRLTAGLFIARTAATAAAPAPRAPATPDEQHATALPRSAVLPNVGTAYADGDRIGSVNAGADCGNSDQREWSPLVRRRVETEVTNVFRDELAKATGP